jgi:hypothetical protein
MKTIAILRAAILAVFILGAESVPGRAQLLNFDFSITSDSNVPGTITGVIVGLQGDQDSSTPIQTEPNDIIITEVPSTLGFAFPSTEIVVPGDPVPVFGYSLRANLWTIGAFVGATQSSFTTVGGNIAPATDFIAFHTITPDTELISLYFDAESTNGIVHYFEENGRPAHSAVANGDGFSGTTYTPLAAPEPNQFALSALAALGAVMLIALRKKVR